MATPLITTTSRTQTPQTPLTTPLMREPAGVKQESTVNKIKIFLSSNANRLLVGAAVLSIGLFLANILTHSAARATYSDLFCASLFPLGLLGINKYYKID